MTSQRESNEATSEAKEALITWYDSQRHDPEAPTDRNVVCAGLVVLEIAKERFPLASADYRTQKNQLKTSGKTIAKILRGFGEKRTYSREGGRTTRGTLLVGEQLVNALNQTAAIRDLTDEERRLLMIDLQAWLMERVREYFNRQSISAPIDPAMPGSMIVASLLEVARAKGQAGPVAQHLVGAKLTLRYPNIHIENYSYTTADAQLGRPGDFLVGDTAIHVTVAPTTELMQKCRRNIENSYRALVLVPEDRFDAAAQMAENEGLANVGILTIESFVGQNIEEIGEFRKEALTREWRQLLDTYNVRVRSVETDLSLQIEIPDNL